MSWENRGYGSTAGEGGGRFRAVLRRVFGDGENPLTWAVPLYTAWGIRVRVHLVFIIVILAQLLWSIRQDQLGWAFMLLAMGSLFVLVLLHEYGHCFAARAVGGSADQIVMWPLGGLAWVDPPRTWRANLLTTLGGPGVNAALWPMLGVALWWVAGWRAVIFNPFDPQSAVAALRLPDGSVSYWLVGLWSVYYTNLILLAFNMLVPMYPMDAGRTLQAILWARMGERQATGITLTVGLVVAIVLFVFAVVAGETILMAIALFGGITCWIERRRLAFAEQDPMLGGYDFSRGYAGLPDEDEDRGPSVAERRRAERSARERVEEDRILAKIATHGLDNLTRGERRTLRRATERRRRG